MEDFSKKGKEYFESGYTCSQAVIRAFEEILGDKIRPLVTAGTGFGGGVGGLRSVCGCVSGMAIVYSAIFSEYEPLEQVKKTKLYKLIQDTANEFREITGDIICKNLLEIRGLQAKSEPSERTEYYYKNRSCGDYVETMVEIMTKKINQLH